MTQIALLWVGLVLQLFDVWLAWRGYRRSGRIWGWACLALGLSAMAARQAFAIVERLSSSGAPGLSADQRDAVLPTAITVLVTVGLWNATRIISVQAAHLTLHRACDEAKAAAHRAREGLMDAPRL